MFKLLCAGLAIVLVANATPTKNMRPGFGRIVGGEDTTIEEFPFQVSLQYHGRHVCGGSVVAPNYIVTAAHCTYALAPDDLTIRAGTNQLESGGVVVSVRTINQHPQYDIFTTDFDVSVLELAENLTFGETIQPIGLPYRARELVDGTKVNVSGWGNLVHEGDLPEILQAVSLTIVNKDTCKRTYDGMTLAVTDRMICAASPGKDACQGDSGGPLSRFSPDITLHGIVSWGLGCAIEGYPGVYTSVADPDILFFITSITGL